MPSDTPSKIPGQPTGIGFSAVIVAVLLLALTIMSAVVVSTGYFVARSAIEQDVDRFFKFNQSITDLVLQSRLQDVRQILELTIQNTNLSAAVRDGDEMSIIDQLSEIYLGQQSGRLDILFAQVASSNRIVDVSIHGHDTAQLLRAAAESVFDITGEVFVTGPPEDPLYSILTRREIIDPVTDRLIGHVYGGTILNDNIGLMRAILERTEASVAALYHGPRVIVSYPPEQWQRLTAEGLPEIDMVHHGDDQLLFESQLTLAPKNGEMFHVVSGHPLGAIAELEQNYLRALYILVGGILIIVAISAWALRWMTQKALWSLSSYANSVAAGEADAVFKASEIREFNEIGFTLEHFVEALRLSEEQAQTILNNAPALVYIKDLRQRYVFVNKQFERHLSRARDEILGQEVHSFFSGDVAKRFEAGDQQVLESGTQTSIEVEIPQEDGIHTYINTKFPLFDTKGQISGVCGISTDITDNKRLEEQVRRSQKLEAVGQLTGGIAHDFNNLLAVLVGNADILEERVGDDAVAQSSLAAMVRAAERGSSLTGRLLAFSRQQALAPVPADIGRLVHGLEDMLRRTLGETVELRVNNADGLWPALIDPHQFENALLNLAINARDAMPQGGILVVDASNISLDAAYAEAQDEVAPGDYVRVAVSDNGDGMPADVVDKAFEPFFTTKDVGKGSGLGLSMVYGFAKQSKGHATIYSEAGQGTTINLFLPRSLEAAAEDSATHDTQVPEHGSERILVVEDDPSVREVPVSILRRHSYHVVEAGNGQEAISCLRDGQAFDLLFTDVILPGGFTGVEIAEQAKALQPDIKVLYATGYAEHEVMNKGQMVPGTSLISKPYRQAELLKRVRMILDDAAA